jgi:hypothetical protein
VNPSWAPLLDSLTILATYCVLLPGAILGIVLALFIGQEVTTMKRILILSNLIVFLIVGCVGPNKVGWTKPDFRQDQFENDRKECIDSIDKNLDSEAFRKKLEECLREKDYWFKAAGDQPSGTKLTTQQVLLIPILIALSPLILAYGVRLIGSPP